MAKTADEEKHSIALQKEIKSVSNKLKELYRLTGLDEDGQKARKEAGFSEAQTFFMIHQRDALELYLFCLENRLNLTLSEEGEGGDANNGNS
ncbi:MAG: hypothetical protein HUJ68_10015 [Clostridia bacterium]|nr:hypothetical protein [Clostridia bacterium]